MAEYVIVSHAETIEVEKIVKKMLNEGWKLAGGISMAYKHEHSLHNEHIPGHLVYAQALVKGAE